MSVYLWMKKHHIPKSTRKEDRKHIINILVQSRNNISATDKHYITHYFMSLENEFEEYISFRTLFLQTAMKYKIGLYVKQFKGIDFFKSVNRRYDELKEWIKSYEIYSYFHYIEAYFEWTYNHIFVSILNIMGEIFKMYFVNDPQYNFLIKSGLYQIMDELHMNVDKIEWWIPITRFFESTCFYYIYDYYDMVYHYVIEYVFNDKDHLKCFDTLILFIEKEVQLSEKMFVSYMNQEKLDFMIKNLEEKVYRYYLDFFSLEIEYSISFFLDNPNTYWSIFYHNNKKDFLGWVELSLSPPADIVSVLFKWINLDKIICSYKKEWKMISLFSFIQKDVFIKEVVYSLLNRPEIFHFHVDNLKYYMDHIDLDSFCPHYFQELRTCLYNHKLQITDELIKLNDELCIYIKSNSSKWNYSWDNIIKEFRRSVELQQFLEKDVSILVSNSLKSLYPPPLYPMNQLPSLLTSKIDSINDIFSIIYPCQKLNWDLDSTKLDVDVFLGPDFSCPSHSISLYIPHFLVFHVLWTKNTCTQTEICHYLPFLKDHITTILQSMSCCIRLIEESQKWKLHLDKEQIDLSPILYDSNMKSVCHPEQSLFENTHKSKCQVLHHLKKQKTSTITDMVSQFPHIFNMTDILIDLSKKEFISILDNDQILYIP